MLFMDPVSERIQQALERTFSSLKDRTGPPRLAAALRYAVFPGGARFRPRLCLAVARANGDPDPAASDAAAVALELVHSASLVHDDLPCFDDAATRRGIPTLHTEFGEPTAVLVGDALIVMAFQALSMARGGPDGRLADMIGALARGVGHPHGIVSGQAWESEPNVGLFAYHHAKTASLFEASCALGAIASGAQPSEWRIVGELLGRAYQIADDVADVTGASRGDKSGGRDLALGRPNALERLGEGECMTLIERLLGDATSAIPACPGREALQAWIREASYGVLRLRAPRTSSADARTEPSRRRANV